MVEKIRMTEWLRASLKRENVPAPIIQHLEAAMDAATVATGNNAHYARSYAHGMDRAFYNYGVDGVKHQTMYLITNLRSWQGETAREAKKVLNKWAVS